ncbi:MAG TPA: hypothetical protein VEA80_02035 [Vitreimonas sp.]|uniref:hypothetical protein n=1 Tax=Vitreimonas sp. TaxID=3069702 RepID=UPI002D6698DE|nr:hypothetical protein [Vitreimonas sp.]HYD86230.1 hypothetical protein [Vitreimonas sp.]
MRTNINPTSSVEAARTSRPIPIDSIEPGELERSAFHEAGHAVANVGLLGHICYDVRAFAEPTLTYDDRARALTVMGLCQTSFGNQPAELTVQSLIENPDNGAMAFARAVNRAFIAAAGPFAQAELLGDGDLFDDVCFPDGGDGDLEHAHDALLPFYKDEAKRWDVLDRVWCRTRDIMRRPQVWAAVEAVAAQLIELGGREPLDGDIVERIVERYLRRRRLRTTAIIPVKWDGSVNTSILEAQRIASEQTTIGDRGCQSSKSRCGEFYRCKTRRRHIHRITI